MVTVRLSRHIRTSATCWPRERQRPRSTSRPRHLHLAVLPYSSGTTAKPKGVKLTHRNLVANVVQIRPLLAMGSDDNILAVLPFFHIYGMTVLLNAATHARVTLVVMQRFDLGTRILESIEKYRITFGFIALPSLSLRRSIRWLTSTTRHRCARSPGAAPLDGELGTAWRGEWMCK